MDRKTAEELARAQSMALRRLASLLETVAVLLETTYEEAPTPRVELEPLVPTRKMPSMEAQARALDDAVANGVPKPVPG